MVSHIYVEVVFSNIVILATISSTYFALGENYQDRVLLNISGFYDFLPDFFRSLHYSNDESFSDPKDFQSGIDQLSEQMVRHAFL
jgi:hypothetical protein